MKLLGISKNGRALRLRPESEDDLWVLYNIIRQGDIVRSRTTRELKTRSGSKRKPMTMAIRVEWTEYQPFTTRLRIHGKIVEAPREYDLIGQRHTINLEIGDEVLIFKEEGWEQYDFKRIKEACRRSSVSLLTVAIDEDEACIALVRDYGIKVMAEIDLNLPGKYDVAGREHELKRKLSHIAKVVEALVNEYKPNAVIVAGPGV
ncbi:MAG: mRNA surveillance protein Pelota, partial [Thermoprotei archaeon]